MISASRWTLQQAAYGFFSSSFSTVPDFVASISGVSKLLKWSL